MTSTVAASQYRRPAALSVELIHAGSISSWVNSWATRAWWSPAAVGPPRARAMAFWRPAAVGYPAASHDASVGVGSRPQASSATAHAQREPGVRRQNDGDGATGLNPVTVDGTEPVPSWVKARSDSARRPPPVRSNRSSTARIRLRSTPEKRSSGSRTPLSTACWTKLPFNRWSPLLPVPAATEDRFPSASSSTIEWCCGSPTGPPLGGGSRRSR